MLDDNESRDEFTKCKDLISTDEKVTDASIISALIMKEVCVQSRFHFVVHRYSIVQIFLFNKIGRWLRI